VIRHGKAVKAILVLQIAAATGIGSRRRRRRGRLDANQTRTTKDGPLRRLFQLTGGDLARRARVVAARDGGFPHDARVFAGKGAHGVAVQTNVLPHGGGTHCTKTVGLRSGW